MARSKLARLQYNETSENVIQERKEIFDKVAGNWSSFVFKNDNPITLEVGCGNGDYTIGLAKQFMDKNYIGLDVKGTRINRGATIANDLGLKHVAFLRTRVHQIDESFGPNEIDEFWITFPDPRPRDRDIRRRLVCPRYINLYKKISKPGAIVNLKTDNHDFYLYALEICQEMNLKILEQTDDLYQSDILDLCFGIKTKYEKMYLEKGIKINYLKFQL